MDGPAAPAPVSLSSPLGFTSIFSTDSPVEICFDWDRRSVSFDCQPAPITQRVGWSPVCRIQAKLKVALALSETVRRLTGSGLWTSPFPKYWEQTQVGALNADTPSSFKIDIFHAFVLLRNLLSYFPVQHRRLTTKEIPLQLWKELFLKASRVGNLVLHHSSGSNCAACAAHVLYPIRALFFQSATFSAHRNVQTLLQHLENTPAHGGSVVSRAQALLLTTVLLLFVTENWDRTTCEKS